VKRVVILQPSYIPWLGYFDQINRADVFVFYDDVQYTRRDWRNRNKVKISSGLSTYLTIPVLVKGEYLAPINAIQIDKSSDWRAVHLKTLESNYKRSKYFASVYPFLESTLLQSTSPYLSECDTILVKKITEYLGIHNKHFVFSSELDAFEPDPTKRLVEICRKLGATHYLTGGAAKAYLDEDLFAKENIVVEYQNYKHPMYTQLWGDFISHLSIIDLLFNEGPRSLEIVMQGSE
jgi:hypothetical protein